MVCTDHQIMKKKIAAASFFIALTMFELTCMASEPANLVGRDMPRLTIENWLSKEMLNARDLRGRIYVFEFWATWCPSCVKIMPHLNDLAQKYRRDEVFFVTFSRDRTAKQAQNFLKEKNINLYAAMAGGVGEKLGVSWIPMAYVVGDNGKVLWQGNPASEAFEAALESAVKSAPPAFLKDVNLGHYEYLRFQLSGCTGFPKAYRMLRMETQRENPKNADIAAGAIKAIDAKINANIEQIRSIQAKDPKAAVPLYRELISKFKGAESTEQAMAEYEKLKDSLNIKEESPAPPPAETQTDKK
jgi:thiol-disulfide isomerase/thioredoxin